MGNKMQNVIYFELADDVLTEGKPFAGFAAGKFIDMWGRKVVTRDKDIPKYIENTSNHIESYKVKGHAGLPIDTKGHDHNEAAGWITGVEAGDVLDSKGKVVKAIMFAVEWTKLGVELIKDKIMANFSATFDDKDYVIKGGSLTNWPATKDSFGVPLLDAIELCTGGRAMAFANMQDDSLDAQSQKVRDAWYNEWGYDELGPYVREVFSEFAIVRNEEGYFKVEYSEEKEEIVFAEEDDWVAVKQTWVNAALSGKMADSLKEETAESNEIKVGANAIVPTTEETSDLEGGTSMDELLLANLKEEERQALLTEARAELAEEFKVSETDEQAILDRLKAEVKLEAFSDVVDVGEYREQMLGQMEEALRAEYGRMQSQAGNMLKGMLAEIKRDQDIIEFSQKVTGGTDDNPHGIPANEGQIEKFLKSLDDGQRAGAMEIIGKVWEKGLVDFVELGHNKKKIGTTPLPEYYATKLTNGELVVADLNDPLLGLGDVAQYNLSEWKEA